MTEYRRNFVKGGSYFFTVALADRRQRLLVDHIDALRGSFHRVKALYPFTIDAIVILPEHLHCIWTLRRATTTIPSGGGASREDFPAMCRVVVCAPRAKN
jgi:putative transposase